MVVMVSAAAADPCSSDASPGSFAQQQVDWLQPSSPPPAKQERQQQQQQQQESLLPVLPQQEYPLSPGKLTPYRTGLTREEAPFYVVYPYVLRGYTCGGDYARCLRAAFELHTETGNAWTMLAGSAVSAALFAAAAAALGPADWAGLLPFACLTGGVLLHMPFSVGFHLFRGISADVYNLWRRLDQIFIFLVSVLLAFGLAWHVYDSWLGLALNTGAALAVAAVGVREIVALQPHFQRHRGQMVVFVGCIVLCYWFPMAYQAGREIARGSVTAATWLAAATFVVLQAGGCVFAVGFPERQWPGVFDVCMFSHQLMHVAAVAAHVLEYAFVWQLHRQRAAALS